MIRGHPVPRQDYEIFMRHQAYVEQKDAHLETLTVWETLAYAAMLRLPEDMSPNKKLRRAAEVLEELDLTAQASSLVGGPRMKGISGGQMRRLSIAVELVRMPQVTPSPRLLLQLFGFSPINIITIRWGLQVCLLDEPTSGLDSAASLRLVQRLSHIAKAGRRTVATTIHQPRADIFELFDQLLLLGNGRVLYSGPPSEAMGYFVAQPQISLNPDLYDNAGDFVIDALELVPSEMKSSRIQANGNSGSAAGQSHSNGDGDEEKSERNEEETRESNETGPATPSDAEDATSRGWGLNARQGIQWALGKLGIRGFGYSLLTFDDEKPQGLILELGDQFVLSEHHLSIMEHIVSGSSVRGRDQPPLKDEIQTLSTFEQMWILFARRMHRLTLDPSSIVRSQFTIILTSCIISYAFSYEVDSKLKVPYQIFMVLLIISSYTFILDYLQLPTEYVEEWPLLKAEHTRGACSFVAYVLSCALSETPRGILHSLLTLTVCYIFNGLNLNTTNVVFGYVCLMTGVNAWQGVICMCSMITDKIDFIYMVIFLLLGGGTLFGGLLITVSNLPTVFKPIYYLSVTAVTQRALIVNDFLCCHLTYNCQDSAAELVSEATASAAPSGVLIVNGTEYSTNDIKASITQTAICPAELDSSEPGNLGRFALGELDLSNVDNYTNLFIIFCVAIGARIAAVYVLRIRDHFAHQMKELDMKQTVARRQQLFGAYNNPPEFAALVKSGSFSESASGATSPMHEDARAGSSIEMATLS